MNGELGFLKYIHGLVEHLILLDGAQRRVRIELLKQAIEGRMDNLNTSHINADGLDRDMFISERIKELLELGESWDEQSARAEAEATWYQEMKARMED